MLHEYINPLICFCWSCKKFYLRKSVRACYLKWNTKQELTIKAAPFLPLKNQTLPVWIRCFYPPVSQNFPSETCPFLSSPFYSFLSALFIHPLADSVFTSKMQSRQMGASGKNMTKSTSIGGDMYTLEKNDGSQSDTAVGTVGGGGKKRRSSIGAKMVAIVGLSRKSRSTSQLSQTGRNWIFFPPLELFKCA